MKKSDLTGSAADRIGLSRSVAGSAVDTVFGALGEALDNAEEVMIIGFGTFTAKSWPTRTGRNPRTVETLEIQASTVRAFRPSIALKDAVNAGNGS